MTGHSLGLLQLLLVFLVYPLIALPLLRLASGAVRSAGFALANVLFALLLASTAAANGVRMKEALDFLPVGAGFALIYLALVCLHYPLITFQRARGNPRFAWFGVAYPLLLLAAIKYLPPAWNPLQLLLHSTRDKVVPEFFMGLSYMAFRLTHMTYELRNNVAEWPTFWEFLGFAFFPPTFSVGPINPFSRFQKSLRNPAPAAPGPALLRMLVGAAKYLLLANIVNQLSWSGLLFDGHPHPPIDILVAAAAFCLFLYCNFSGYCDMAIGVSALMGISVMENFDNPLAARNIQDFWNRWHISLSVWIRDVMFTPLTKSLVRRMGPARANHAVAITIFVCFVVVGVWHGTGWNFLLFGVWNGLGLVACHYYTAYLRKRLGKQGYARYHENRWIQTAAVAVTFLYFSFGLTLFANTLPQIGEIYRAIR